MNRLVISLSQSYYAINVLQIKSRESHLKAGMGS